MLRLRLFLFQKVDVEQKDYGRIFIHCSGPKDMQVVERLEELLGMQADGYT